MSTALKLFFPLDFVSESKNFILGTRYQGPLGRTSYYVALAPICNLFLNVCLALNCLPLSLQLSFQMWTNQMQETLNSKKHGDTAFRAKDFATAIDCYTQVSFPCYVESGICGLGWFIFLYSYKQPNTKN
jgi:hypothetical protein